MTVGVVVGLIGLAAITFGQADHERDGRARPAQRGEGLLLARCAVCHSIDLVQQQRLPRDRWEATVQKMIRWGAELSEEEAGVLVDYLSAMYHPDAPNILPRSDVGRRQSPHVSSVIRRS